MKTMYDVLCRGKALATNFDDAENALAWLEKWMEMQGFSDFAIIYALDGLAEYDISGDFELVAREADDFQVSDEDFYNQFLAEYCQCFAGCDGNRPCDNGCLCNKCMTREALNAWCDFRSKCGKE